MEIDFEKDVMIDPDSLDVEWLEQPRLMIRYSQVLAEAKRTYEEAKQRLDVIKADMDKSVRKSPENYGLEKVTETAIQSAISASGPVQQAQANVVDAAYDMNMAQGAVIAIQGRKDALENLVRLHGQQYFAGPQIPRNLSQEWENKAKQKHSDRTVGRIRRRRND